MPTEAQFEAATAGLNRSLEKIRKRMVNDAELTFEQWLTDVTSMFQAERLTGPPGLNRRTGNLARSFYTTVEGAGLNSVGLIGSRAPYAKVHEYGTGYLPGGVIKSKRPGGSLAIPIPGGPALTAAGVYRFGARSLREVLPQIAPHLKFFVMPRDGKAPLLVGADPETGEITPWFVLKKSVKIKPKMGLRKIVKRELGRLLKALTKRFSGATRG